MRILCIRIFVIGTPHQFPRLFWAVFCVQSFSVFCQHFLCCFFMLISISVLGRCILVMLFDVGQWEFAIGDVCMSVFFIVLMSGVNVGV